MILSDSILGHVGPRQQLGRARRSGRVAHAYLFHGPDGVGKQRVALAFAQELNCAAGGERACGECESCKKIERLNHPDVRLLACEAYLKDHGLLEIDKPSLQIKKEQLDELADLFRHRPYLGRTKVLLVIDAERMNVNSQNRFLKTLEEPNADSVILLVTSQPEALLSTIRSRCQALAFGPLGRDLVCDQLVALQGIEPERARVLAAMAQGSLGRAIALSEGGELAVRDEALGTWSRALEGDLADVLQASEGLGAGREAREALEASLDLMELWFRDLVLCLLEVEPGLLVNQDRREELQRQAVTASARTWLRRIERLRQVRATLRFNANPRMALEAMLLDMRDT